MGHDIAYGKHLTRVRFDTPSYLVLTNVFLKTTIGNLKTLT